MAKVFVVDKLESPKMNYHAVHYTRGNNLNKGKTAYFKSWDAALAFAAKKAAEYKCRIVISKH